MSKAVDFSFLTPTRGRPEALKLCQEYVKRMTWRTGGSYEWIIVDSSDDAGKAVILSERFPAYVDVRYIHHKREGLTNFHQNLLQLVEEARGEYLVIIEDDDWYSVQYLEALQDLLERGVQALGFIKFPYYHLGARRWIWCGNENHASLMGTTFRRELIPHFQDVLLHSEREGSIFVDLGFWERIRDSKEAFNYRLKETKRPLAVGMKGLPGTPNLGCGKDPSWLPNFDPDMKQLKEWIGRDIEGYEAFHVS